jgi:transcriptional regulator CtsR
MAKLYAELTSDKGGRVASKGGDGYMRVVFYKQNRQTHTVIYRDDGTIEVLDFQLT